jgi:hypothetical protein
VTTMMAATPVSEVSCQGVQRRLAALLQSDQWIESPRPLELSTLGAQDPPRLISASLLEDRELRAHAVDAATLEPRFAAFLDGTQTSTVIAHVDGVPIVHGAVAAVIRQRVDRRMRTWNVPRVGQAMYVPLGFLTSEWADALATLGLRVVDTLTQSGANETSESPHPFALQDAAIHAVQAAREVAERELAERWCDSSDEYLFIDGAIAGSDRVATSAAVVGVVKSHRTLYAEGDALRGVLRLKRGERTSVFRVTSPRRTPVASWYLRLRDTTGRDPLWGLVRVEVAEQKGATAAAVGARADVVSRWVLAETLPLSIPDGRWDKMVYGIRDCEEFLRAIQ